MLISSLDDAQNQLTTNGWNLQQCRATSFWCFDHIRPSTPWPWSSSSTFWPANQEPQLYNLRHYKGQPRIMSRGRLLFDSQTTSYLKARYGKCQGEKDWCLESSYGSIEFNWPVDMSNTKDCSSLMPQSKPSAQSSLLPSCGDIILSRAMASLSFWLPVAPGFWIFSQRGRKVEHTIPNNCLVQGELFAAFATLGLPYAFASTCYEATMSDLFCNVLQWIPGNLQGKSGAKPSYLDAPSNYFAAQFMPLQLQQLAIPGSCGTMVIRTVVDFNGRFLERSSRKSLSL